MLIWPLVAIPQKKIMNVLGQPGLKLESWLRVFEFLLSTLILVLDVSQHSRVDIECIEKPIFLSHAVQIFIGLPVGVANCGSQHIVWEPVPLDQTQCVNMDLL